MGLRASARFVGALDFVRDGGLEASYKSCLRREETYEPDLTSVPATRCDDPNRTFLARETWLERAGGVSPPRTGVKLWIEPRKRKWSRNSAKSSKALALWWLPTTPASRLPRCSRCAQRLVKPMPAFASQRT